MRPLRVVLVLPDPPTPFCNAASRYFHVLVRGLAERGHRLTVFVACDPRMAAEAEVCGKLFPADSFDIRIHPHPRRGGIAAKVETLRRPYSHLYGRDLREALGAVLEEGYDILHLEGVWTGWLGLNRRAKALLTVHNLAEIDLAEERPRGLADRLRRRSALGAERRLVRSYPHLAAVSPRLAERLREIAPAARVRSLVVGLDSSQYPFPPGDGLPDAPTVGLIGSFDWAPSRSAGLRLLTRLWPEIKRRVPSARLQIVGRDARKVWADWLGNPDIRIEENVPDILPYFASTDVLLYAPSRGSGTKVKVMEAFALGTPVVTTREGVEGLEAFDGIQAGVCEDDAGLVERTVSLLLDPARREAQRLAARELIEKGHGVGATMDRIEEIYHQILAPEPSDGKG